jgi:hypothetical protein
MEVNIMNLIEAYLAGHKACGLKVGDKVRVTRSAENYEQGWNNDWSSGMDDYVNEINEITQDCYVAGFVVGNCYSFPWFILEKVEDAEETIKISDLDFGCQQDHVEILVSRIIDYIDSKL